MAIVSVVVFHGFPALAPGGFVGVDVFFVISGFLITQNILTDLTNKNFCLLSFYDRRIRRIFPALVLTLAIGSFLSWLFLLPTEFAKFGTQLTAGAGFFSNFTSWKDAGYFDLNAQSKPLLHLWSLSIEEQFYIFLPLLLMVTCRLSRRLTLILLSLALVSFSVNIFFVHSNPVAAFYSPVTRMWELLIGSIAASAMVGRNVSRFTAEKQNFLVAALSVIGLALALNSFVFISEADSFPGFVALAPTAATLLLIVAGPRAIVNRLVLANPIFAFIGRISYPLYLWHWVLLSMLSIVNGINSNYALRIATLLLASVLAWVTYEFVEKPIRSRQWTSASAPSLALALSVFLVIGFAIQRGQISSRSGMSVDLKPIFSAINDWRPEDYSTDVKGNSSGRVLIIGDSFTGNYVTRIASVVKSHTNSLSVSYAGTAGCPPIPNLNRIAYPGDCVKANDAAFLEAMEPDVKRVVLLSAWHYFYPLRKRHRQATKASFEHDVMMYSKDDPHRTPISFGSTAYRKAFSDLRGEIAALRKAGKEVYIVLPTPMSDSFDPSLMVDRLSAKPILSTGIPKSQYYASFQPMIDELTAVAHSTGAELLDPAEDLCRNDFCSAVYDGKPIYKDFGHIRPFFTRNNVTVFDHVVLDQGQRTNEAHQR